MDRTRAQVLVIINIFKPIKIVYCNLFVNIISGTGVTLGSAVTASMNLTNSTEGMEASAQVHTYKTETTQSDMHLYYQVILSRFLKK